MRLLWLLLLLWRILLLWLMIWAEIRRGYSLFLKPCLRWCQLWCLLLVVLLGLLLGVLWRRLFYFTHSCGNVCCTAHYNIPPHFGDVEVVVEDAE